MQEVKCACGSSLFWSFKEKLSSTFLNGSTFLQNILTKMRTSARTALPRSVPTSLEALLLFHGIALVNECLPDGRLQAKMPSKMGCCTGVANKIVIRNWSAL